jgi:hypothetical protein
MDTRQRRPPGPGAFQDLQATELFCPRCRIAQPVRERLLLVLPDGELLEYRCETCGTAVGQRRVGGGHGVVLPG